MSFGKNHAWQGPSGNVFTDQHDQHSVVGVVQAAKPPRSLKMDEISRPELDAKLELIETRMDGRMKDIHSHIKTLLDVNERMIKNTDEARKESKTWSLTVIATVVTTTIAMIFSVWQIVTGLSQSNIAWFESGRNIGAAQQTVPEKAPDPAVKKDKKP